MKTRDEFFAAGRHSVDLPPRRLVTLPVILLLTPVLGAVAGVVTNFVNWLVSDEYFSLVLQYSPQASLEAAMVHGVIEGAALGLFFGVVFTIASAASSGFRVAPMPAVVICLAMVGLAIVCWAIGGIVGAAFAAVDPTGFTSRFPLSLRSSSLARFAWVGGTIWGVYAGAAIASITGAIVFHRAWKKSLRRAGFAVEV